MDEQHKSLWDALEELRNKAAGIETLVLRDTPGQVEPGAGKARCPSCDALVSAKKQHNFCPWCGKALSWEAWNAYNKRVKEAEKDEGENPAKNCYTCKFQPGWRDFKTFRNGKIGACKYFPGDAKKIVVLPSEGEGDDPAFCVLDGGKDFIFFSVCHNYRRAK